MSVTQPLSDSDHDTQQRSPIYIGVTQPLPDSDHDTQHRWPKSDTVTHLPCDTVSTRHTVYSRNTTPPIAVTLHLL